MVPQINDRGRSFKGVTAYLLHDKQAETSERVEFTATRNLPFEDVERASKFMAWTDINSETLKDNYALAQGMDAPKSGRPRDAGAVLHCSLSWRDDQEPSREHMTQAADDWVKNEGWSEHQYYLVGHNDTDHAHIHIVINLVHPVTGKIADQSNSKLKSDRHANEYEHEMGEIVCENRAAKYKAMEQDRPAFAEKEHREEAGRLISEAYHASDSGAAFRAALEENGFDLAEGRSRAIVVVDQEGHVYSPSRAIEGVKVRDINKLFKDVDKDKLPFADDLEYERKNYGRDQAEADRQNAMLDAADEAAQRKIAAEDVDLAGGFDNATHEPHEVGSIVQLTRGRAQGEITGFDKGRYEVTFTNRRSGRESFGAFKPDDIQLVRTRQQEEEYQYQRERQRAHWEHWNIVRERQIQERIEARHEYWQIDKLQQERDQAKQALDDRSGWVDRYVLRWRYNAARDELDAKQKTLDHAQERWQTDIDAIQVKRTDELRDKLQRDMSEKELADYAKVLMAQAEERIERERAARHAGRSKGFALGQGVDPEIDNEIRGRERDGVGGVAAGGDDGGKDQDLRAKAEKEEKLQRDMSQEELDELEARLMDEAQQEIEIQTEENEVWQRHMTEEELEAYRDRLLSIEEEARERDADLDRLDESPDQGRDLE